MADYNFQPWVKSLEKVPCFILGNGPSLEDKNLDILNDYFTIGINRIFKIFDPTILMWQDLALWLQHKKEILRTKAIKYCRKASDTKSDFYHFKMSGRDHRIATTPVQLYGRGSSGPLAYQLSWALGCDPIVLIGMDCKYKGKLTNFYGKNPMHKSHTLPHCVKGLQWIQSASKDKTIINCSDNDVFLEKLTIEQAVEKVGESLIKGREALTKKILGQ